MEKGGVCGETRGEKKGEREERGRGGDTVPHL
jgi:hypothetical protein